MKNPPDVSVSPALAGELANPSTVTVNPQETHQKFIDIEVSSKKVTEKLPITDPSVTSSVTSKTLPIASNSHLVTSNSSNSKNIEVIKEKESNCAMDIPISIIYIKSENSSVTCNMLPSELEMVWDRKIDMTKAWVDFESYKESVIPEPTIDNFVVLCEAYGIRFAEDYVCNKPRMYVDDKSVDSDLLTLNEASIRIQTLLVRHGLRVRKAEVYDWIKVWAKANKFSSFADEMLYKYTREGDSTAILYLDAWLDTFEFEDNGLDPAIMRLWLKNYVVAGAAMQIDPDAHFPYAPVIIGPQGIGKTSKFRELWCGDRFTDKPWYRSEMAFDPSNKEDILKCIYSVAQELSEVETWHKKDQAAMKRWLSTDRPSITPKYENDPITPKKKSVMVITGNFEEFLTDSSGHRRYLPISVKSISFDYQINDFDIGKVWADAVYLVKSGYNYHWVDTPETTAYKARYQADVSDTQAAFDSIYNSYAPVSEWVETSPSKILSQCLSAGCGNKINSRSIMAYLRKLSGNPQLNSTVKKVGGRVQRVVLCPKLRIPAEVLEGRLPC